jgi:hypothetical protein
MEVLEGKTLIGAVPIIGDLAQTNEEDGGSGVFFDIGDNGDGTALATENGIDIEAAAQGVECGLYQRVVRVEVVGRCVVGAAKF